MIGYRSRLPHLQAIYELIVRNISLLLGYANRFYERQFFTRKKVSSDLSGRPAVEVYGHVNTGTHPRQAHREGQVPVMEHRNADQ